MHLKHLAFTFLITCFLSSNTHAINCLTPKTLITVGSTIAATITGATGSWSSMTFKIKDVPEDYIDKFVTTSSKCMSPPFPNTQVSNTDGNVNLRVSGHASGKGWKCFWGASENNFELRDRWGNTKVSGTFVDPAGQHALARPTIESLSVDNQLSCTVGSNGASAAKIHINCAKNPNKTRRSTDNNKSAKTLRKELKERKWAQRQQRKSN